MVPLLFIEHEGVISAVAISSDGILVSAITETVWIYIAYVFDLLHLKISETLHDALHGQMKIIVKCYIY